jgi:hypothetical protein
LTGKRKKVIAVDIRVRPYPACYVCGGTGKLLYDGLRDRLFEAPGDWSFKRCVNRDCGLIWLDPMPMPDDIGYAYRTYFTHRVPNADVSTKARLTGRIKNFELLPKVVDQVRG